VLTQCVAFSNVMKSQTATVGNIILKLNAKLGGVNHCVDISNIVKNSTIDFVRYPILIMGADVTHPSANSLVSKLVSFL
jgi:Piwi domain